MDEEAGGEDGVLSSAKDAKGKITKKSMKLCVDALIEAQIDLNSYKKWEDTLRVAKLVDPASKESKKQAKVAKVKMAELWSVAKQVIEQSDDFVILRAYDDLMNRESLADKASKEAKKTLDAKVAAKYAQLTKADIQTLVVQDKWLATLAASVQSELDRVSQSLTGRIRQLAERYATPLPALGDEVEVLAVRVDKHLKAMGFVWN